MKCFVIAMDKECAPLLSRASIVSDSVLSGRRVYRCNLFGEEVGVVVSGVGKVNAACGTQLAIDLLGGDKIINIGVAGGLNKSVEVGKMYSISHAVQYDFDLSQINGTPVGTLDEYEENYLKLTPSPLFPAKKLASGDRFDDSPKDYEILTKVLSADIRDMEGGAIAHACARAGVECYLFKAISDIAGSGSTTEQYVKNLDICLKNVAANIQKIAASV